MQTPAKMIIVRGEICDYSSESRYDSKGMEYRAYTLKINNTSYEARIPMGIYIKEGTEVLLEVEGKTVLSGYLIKEGQKWGRNSGKLKHQLGRYDRYEFVEGTVMDKHKTPPSSYDYMHDHVNPYISYTVLMDNKAIQASGFIADKLKPAMEIAAVVKNNDMLLVLNKKTGKLIGITWAYYIPFSITFVVCNLVMLYLYYSHQTHIINYTPTLWVMNIFLILGIIISFKAYRKDRKAKKFLFSRIQKTEFRFND